MTKGTGTTRSGSAANPTGVGGGSNMSSADNNKISTLQTSYSIKASMPSNYNKIDISIGGVDMTISAVPTGYGVQQKRNGVFIISYKDGENLQSIRERWGDSYAKYTSKSEAWKNAKKTMISLAKKINSKQ